MEDELPTTSERLFLWQRCLQAQPQPAALSAGAWAETVATRIAVEGGSVLGRIAGSVACSFDTIELDDVLALVVDLLAEVERSVPGLEVAYGLSVGRAEHALDRAQLLANRANGGEVALDESAYVLAQDHYLFTRSLRAGALRGEVLDRRFPRRSACRAAVAKLADTPLPPNASQRFAALRKLVQSGSSPRVAIRRRSAHTALDWIDRLALELNPPLVLQLSRRAAGLQPLGALSLALWRARAKLPAAPPSSALARLTRGAGVTRLEAARALRELMQSAAGSAAPAWIVIDRLHEIDAPSLAVVADALRDSDLPCVLLMTLPPEAGVPAALLRAGACQDVSIEPLSASDRELVAGHALGLPPGSEVARRVALLGGDTRLGIVEAARTLIGAGDLVHLDGEFRWRTTPRAGSEAIPTDALLTERMAHLDSAAHRVLEAVCIAAKGADRRSIEQLALRDGLDAESVARGFVDLELEGWLDALGELGPMQAMVRGAMRNSMPPARAAELHRFAAEVLSAELAPDAVFGRGLLAHHLAEGGQEPEAAAAVLDVAQAATAHGFERMGVRLAAFALKLSDGPELRRRALFVARSVDSRPRKRSSSVPVPIALSPDGGPEGSAPASHAAAASEVRREEPAEDGNVAREAIGAAIRALVQGDADSADDFIDTAVAAGYSQSGAQRLSAIALLSRGDIAGAVSTLKHLHAGPATPTTRAREAITAGLILLESGQVVDAIRSALEALCAVRAIGDDRGELAALQLLAACYRVLGRDADATRLEARAGL